MALAAASSPIWWSQATSNEVYGLHLFYVSLILLLVVRLLGGKNPRRTALVLAYVLGLAFTNHLQTVHFLPTLFFLFVFNWKSWRFDGRTWLAAVLLLGLGLSPYLYLPIRSSFHPLADWGGTANLGNFLRHVTGWQYRVFMFTSPLSRVLENARTALGSIASQFFWPFWLLLPGLYFLCRPNWKILFAFGLYPVATFVYNTNYDIPDIDFYYLPVILILYLLMGVGTFGWLGALSKLKKGGSWAPAVLVFGLFLAVGRGIWSNWAGSDESKNRFAQEALENIYKSAPAGGFVFSNVWDHYTAWYYNRYVLGRRPDLEMLDINLTNRSWYLDFVKRTLPGRVSGLEGKIDSVRAMIRDFERGRPFEPMKIEAAYQSMLAAVLRKNFATGPVYFDESSNFDSAAGWVFIPEGALYRIYSSPGYYPYQTPFLGFSRSEDSVLMEDSIAKREVEALALMRRQRENYERAYAPKSSGAEKPNRP